jgi:type VI secretion system secreted protein VgrG
MEMGTLTEMLEFVQIDAAHRPLCMRLPCLEETVYDELYLQQVEGREGIGEGLCYQLFCVSQKAGLELKRFIGQPAEIRYTMDNGAAHRVCGIVTSAQEGAGDGGLASYRLELRDITALFEKRNNSRVFRHLNEMQITEKILEGWRQAYPLIALSFNWERSCVTGDYPAREFTFQYNESDAHFLKRLWARRGISWVIRAGHVNPEEDKKDDFPVHTLVLFDDSRQLAQNIAGAVRFHRAAATEERDAITLWSPIRELRPARVTRHSWDYQTSQVSAVSLESRHFQGENAFQIAGILDDFLLETPHAGDDSQDHQALEERRMARHDLEAKYFEGEGNVRSFSAGTWFELSGHYEIDTHPEAERQFLITRLAVWARNNLPHEIDPRVNALFARNQWEAPASFSENQRHLLRFDCVRRNIPVVPDFDPRRDLPKVPPMSARVVGPQGQEVWCDEQGRVKIMILGLRAEDHRHASGVGTNHDDSDSAWVRVLTPWAHENYGDLYLPRVGSEVLVDWVDGDPDKPVIMGVLYNSTHTPPTFSHLGELPGNRFVSGIKTKEISGDRYNQIRFDDTPGEISAQLSSEHAHSQVNLGWLTHPRADGEAKTRGEGVEIRTDAAAAIRGKQGILVTTDPRPQAQGEHLERNELLELAKILQGIQQKLDELAQHHRAEEANTQSLSDALEKLESWQQDGGAPLIALSAQSALAAASQDNIALMAQSQLDSVSGENTQISAGRKLLLRAQQGLAAFAHTLGLKLVAASGKVQIEAHQDEIELVSAKKIVLSARDEIVLNAPLIRHTAQGAQITLGNSSVVTQTDGSVFVKAAWHIYDGPQGATPEGVDVPQSDLKTDERFVLYNSNSGTPVAEQSYKITLSDGKVIEGITDNEGKTLLAKDEAFMIAALSFPEVETGA